MSRPHCLDRTAYWTRVGSASKQELKLILAQDAKLGAVTMSLPSGSLTTRRLIKALVVLSICDFAISAVASAGGPTFATVDFPGATGTYAEGINGTTIVGDYQDSSGTHGFVRSGGIFTSLDFPTAPQGSETHAFGVNSSGMIVGYYDTPSGQCVGFTFAGDTYSVIANPLSTCTRMFGINSAGTVVGDATISGHRYGYEVLHGSHVTFDNPAVNYPPDGRLQTYAFGINEKRAIVGVCQTSGTELGYLRTATGEFTDIVFPGASATIAFGINRERIVVGVYSMQGPWHGFAKSGDEFFQVDYPGAVSTLATGVSDDGDITGYYMDPANRAHGFVYSGAERKTDRR